MELSAVNAKVKEITAKVLKKDASIIKDEDTFIGLGADSLKSLELVAAFEDDLSQTIDYVRVNTIVVEEMAIPSKLIEHVGQRIVNRLNEELESLEKLRVKIIKLSPPINGDVDNVAIIIEE